MRVSFKVSKKGVRFRPKFKPEPPSVPEDNGKKVDCRPQLAEIQLATTQTRSVDVTDDRDVPEVSDAKVSFILNIFPDGYSIENPSEGNVGHQNAVQDGSKFLCPYDSASQSLFTAIECGMLPSDFLDDIPCKYNNGTVVCEVRDYRTDSSESEGNGPSTVASPSINRVSLRMSLDTVLKDIAEISDSSWTYGDLMEMESRILKILNPRLNLDPTPNLDKLCKDPTSINLNVNIRDIRRKRLKRMSGAATEGKVILDEAPENPNLRLGDSTPIMHPSVTRPPNHATDASIPAVSNQPKSQIGAGNPRPVQNHAFNMPGASSQGMMSTHTDDMSLFMSSILGKRGNQGGHPSSTPNLSKRGRPNTIVLDGNQQQIDGINAPESRWKNTLVQQQQSNGGGIQYPNAGMQNRQMFDGSNNREAGAMPFSMGQQGLRCNLKQEPVEVERMEQSRLQQRLRQQFTRSNFAQPPRNIGTNNRKDEQSPRPSTAQSPRISAGMGLPKEFSTGLIGMQFGAAAFQRDKPVVTSVPAVGVTQSLTRSTNDSMQHQHQGHMARNLRSNSLPRTPVSGGVGSPCVVNMSGPFAASSPVGKEADRSLLDRFSKIEMLTVRFQLNCKRNKIDKRKGTTTFPTQHLMHCLFNDHNNETLKDETCKMPLSKSVVGGNMNICKTRVLKFLQPEHLLQGNGVPLPSNLHTRMILTEKPSDGTVAMYYGDLDDGDNCTEDERLPTLPNTHTADLLAAQFCSLMVREGYRLESDHLQPKPINTVQSSGGEMQKIQESVSGGSSNEDIKITNGGNVNIGGIITSSRNMPSSRLQPQGNLYAHGNPYALSHARLLPFEQQPSLYQNPHSLMQQRSSLPMMPPSHLNTMGQNSNMQLGNHNMTMTSPHQLQLLQQQREMMIAGMGQNPMTINQASTIRTSITQQLRSSQLTPAHAASIMATKLQMAQMQSLTHVPIEFQGGSRQIHPASTGLSMLGSGINRTTHEIQQNVMTPLNMLSGSGIEMNQNLYMMNQQQLHLQQQMQQWESITSQLQSVGSPSFQHVGSPLIGMPHQQQASPQTMSMSPQMSSGGICSPMESTGVGSPQTLGSVGTMANSPM